MTTYKELQTELKNHRANGITIECKLSAKAPVLEAEIERINVLLAEAQPDWKVLSDEADAICADVEERLEDIGETLEDLADDVEDFADDVSDALFSILAELFTLAIIELPKAHIAHGLAVLTKRIRYELEPVVEAALVLSKAVSTVKDSIVFQSFYRGTVALVALIMYLTIIQIQAQLGGGDEVLRLAEV